MINPSVASVKYQPVSINHATNLNLKVRTTSANSVRTKREQRTNNARTAYEQRANYARTAHEQRANYERELTRELRDAPVCPQIPSSRLLVCEEFYHYHSKKGEIHWKAPSAQFLERLINILQCRHICNLRNPTSSSINGTHDHRDFEVSTCFWLGCSRNPCPQS